MNNHHELPFSIFEKCREWQSFSPGLDRVSHVLEALGNPHHDYFHVAVGGTNGKGFVSYNLALNAPEPCGLFISPHVLDIRERITLAGEWFSDEDWRKAYLQIVETVHNPDLSYFEWLLVLAVVIFKMKGCRQAVFEVGLGGRLDAVNALIPNVSIITNVSLDHMDILGNCVEQIASEKIEIARSDRPIFIPKALAQYPKIIKRLSEIGCNQIFLDLGEGIQANSRIVEHILKYLDWPKQKVFDTLPGRQEIIKPGLYLDGAHNQAGWVETVKWIRRAHGKPLNVLCSLSQGRNPKSFLAAIQPIAKEAFIWNVAYEKALPVEQWPDQVEVIETKNIDQLLSEDLLVVGSLYMVGLFKKYLENSQIQ